MGKLIQILPAIREDMYHRLPHLQRPYKKLAMREPSINQFCTFVYVEEQGEGDTASSSRLLPLPQLAITLTS